MGVGARRGGDERALVCGAIELRGGMVDGAPGGGD